MTTLEYWLRTDPAFAYAYAVGQSGYAQFYDASNSLNQAVTTTVIEEDAGATVQGGGGSDAAQSFDYALSGIVDIAWAQEPYRTLWGVRSDGLLTGFTYMPDQQVMAWHRHPFVNAVVESVCVVPQPGESGDRVWMVVRREVNGEVVRHVEYMTAPYEPASSTDRNGFCFVDSSLVYDDVATTTITGLDHLEGETVSVWGDGVDQGDYVVSGGSITLDTAVSYAVIGLHSPARAATLPLEAGSRQGVSQGRKQLLESAIVRVVNAGGLGFATPEAPVAVEVPPFRIPQDLQDTPPPLYTGDVEVDPASGWVYSSQMAFAALRPYPLTVTLGVFDIQVADR